MSFFEKKQKISPEKTEAYLDYKKKAKKGDVTAQFYLGECYYNGTGVEQNREKALKWYSKAADAGNPEAQYMLGECWEKGYGTLRNKETAIHWYTLSAKQGFLDAQTHLAYLYSNRGDHQESFYWHCAAAEQGDIYSIKWVGYYYLFGRGGVKKNYCEAVRCFQKLMELGQELGSANHYMGICYEHGYGVEKDPQKAFIHYSDAVFKYGNCYAEYELAKCYENGFGVTRNVDLAIRLYDRPLRDSRAQYALGQIYYTGKGVEKNIEKAVSHFQSAALAEHPDACYMLGYLYYSGIGVSQDYDMAVFYLRRSEENGNKEAAELIDRCNAEKEKSNALNRAATYQTYEDQSSRALDEQMRMHERHETMRRLNDITTFSTNPDEVDAARKELYDMGFYDSV